MRRKVGNLSFGFVLSFLTLSIFLHAGTAEAGFYANRLTDNNYRDTAPQIHGHNVVWQSHDGNDYEIKLWTGSGRPIRLTDNTSDDIAPQISNTNVVWQYHDGNDFEIRLWPGSGPPINLTDNGYDDVAPQISGNNIVWHGSDGTDHEIRYRPAGGAVRTLTDNGNNDSFPQISGDNLVWWNAGVYFWPGAGPNQQVFIGATDPYPQISGSTMVWAGSRVADKEIFYARASDAPIQLTDNSYDDRFPQISRDNIVWLGYKGPDSEVFFQRIGGPRQQLTDNGSNEISPKISGDKVVWQGFTGLSWEIFSWSAGGRVQQVSKTGFSRNAQVSGDNIVWEGLGRAEASEIFFASYENVPPIAKVRAPRFSTKKSRLPRFTVTWSGYDPLSSTAARFRAGASGIASYDVQFKIGGRGLWRWFRRNTDRRRGVFKGRVGQSIYFRVRARDGAGNLGRWSRQKRTIIPFDNGHFTRNLGFRGAGRKNTRDYRGTIRHSRQHGDTMVFRKRCDLVALIVRTGRRMSRGRIFINGVPRKRIDTYSRKRRSRQAVFVLSFNKTKTRSIKIVNEATRGRRNFFIDAVAFGR